MSDGILTLASARDYFRQAVDAVLHHHGISPRAATSGYLVDLLCDFLTRSIEELDEPLGVVMTQSRASAPARRVRQLKRVGDDSLYISGFFRESLQRRHIDLDYYLGLGGSAYQLLSEMIRRQGKPTQLSDVFRELSGEFGLFAEVLADVRLQSALDDDVPQLYETWLQTRSKLVASRLREAGMLRLPADDKGADN